MVGNAVQAAVNNPLFGVRRWADRLEALPGTTYNPSSMDFSGTQINLANTRGLRDIYAMVRYGNSDRVAKTVGDAWTAGTVAQRKVILKNAIFDTVFSMAKQKLPGTDEYLGNLKAATNRADIQNALDTRGNEAENYLTQLGKGDVVKAVKERFENHFDAMNIDGVNPERDYGGDEFGNRIKGPAMPDGEIQAGITRNQTGNASIPNIVEARRMAAAIQSTKVHRVLAGADDWTYDHITQGFFKPMVLMSVGYGWHISLAELIPNTLRLGAAKTAKAFYNVAVGRLGYKEAISEGDVKGLAGFLYHMGAEKAVNNSQEAQWATDWYVLSDGARRPTRDVGGDDQLR